MTVPPAAPDPLDALIEVLAERVATRVLERLNGRGAGLAPLAANGHGNGSPGPPAEDRLLRVREAAQRLGVKPRWLYVHADDFPFTKRLPGRRLQFSAAGLAAWLDRRRP